MVSRSSGKRFTKHAFAVIRAAAVGASLTAVAQTSRDESRPDNPGKLPSAAAVLRFDREEWDFGDVAVGQTVRHVFRMTNLGSAPVRIRNVRTACSSCVTARAEKTLLAAGQTTTVTATLRTHRPRPKGKTAVFIETDLPREAVKKLYVTYRINAPPVPVAEIVPRNVSLGLMLAGQRREFNAKICNRGAADLVITGTTIGMPPAEIAWAGEPIQFPVRLKPGETRDLSLVFSPSKAIGFCQRSVALQCNDPKRPRVFCAVSAYVATREEIRRLLDDR